MRKIVLTKGKVAYVSDEDYEYLSSFNWHANGSGKTFYAMRTTKTGHKILMHRVVAERAGIDTTNLIDHIDRDGLNNQRDNLRSATKKQNAENIEMFSHNKSGVRGVWWCKTRKRWQTQISHNRKKICLGRYINKEDAIKARKEAEKKYWTHSEVCL